MEPGESRVFCFVDRANMLMKDVSGKMEDVFKNTHIYP
jgi:hypothetical protein